jgi:hypothetical protein
MPFTQLQTLHADVNDAPPLFVSAVGILPVTECDYDDEQYVVPDRIDDPVIADTHTVPRAAP